MLACGAASHSRSLLSLRIGVEWIPKRNVFYGKVSPFFRANLFGPGHPASRGGFFGKCRMELLCVFTKTLV
jgi:hypothetical protein